MARILSIEDDADFQHLISLTLRNQGYEVHYAFTGKEGYEKILSLHPDLVILDVMLPLMNGLEIITQVKLNKATQDIPIIVTTAFYDQVSFIENSIKALGVVEYIRKPVQLGELVKLIQRILVDRKPRPLLGTKLRKGKILIDPKFRTVWVDDRLIATLPIKRFETLRMLIQSKGEVPRNKLVEKIWGEDGKKNNLEKTIQRLRKDLGSTESLRIHTTLNGYELLAD